MLPTPTPTSPTSVSLTFRLDEDGTVYWVAVPAGTPYPWPEPGTNQETAPLNSLYAILQVTTGMNKGTNGLSGTVRAVMNQDGTINVAGMLPEQAYDFYYIAKDDDVWVYTGVTSATADNSIIGFVLVKKGVWLQNIVGE